jgi:hypothetical protein
LAAGSRLRFGTFQGRKKLRLWLEHLRLYAIGESGQRLGKEPPPKISSGKGAFVAEVEGKPASHHLVTAILITIIIHHRHQCI